MSLSNLKLILKNGLILGISAALITSCSSAKKKSSSPELSQLQGKKVALIDIQGEETSRRVVEVALINQLVQRGTFILVSKEDVEKVRVAPDQDTTDWKSIAKKAGADYALRAKVLQFDAPVREGYSSREIYDSQLAEENGTDGKTQQLYKVKAMNGAVKVQLDFTQLDSGETKIGIAEAQKTVEASAIQESIHLPPALRFLEELSNQAFKDFFDRYY